MRTFRSDFNVYQGKYNNICIIKNDITKTIQISLSNLRIEYKTFFKKLLKIFLNMTTVYTANAGKN